MYDVDTELIHNRLEFISFLEQTTSRLVEEWQEEDSIYSLAQERLFHLVIETVTDISSCLIDGLMLREASSYEDMIQVLADEEVFPEQTAELLFQCVRLRKPLVQQYVSWERGQQHPLLFRMHELLNSFKDGVYRFMEKEIPKYAPRRNGGSP